MLLLMLKTDSVHYNPMSSPVKRMFSRPHTLEFALCWELSMRPLAQGRKMLIISKGRAVNGYMAG